MIDSKSGGKDEGGEFRPPVAEVRTFEKAGDKTKLVLRFVNNNTRALHYIGDVRRLLFDPGSGKLQVLLTDAGRQIIPGIAHVEPRFRIVDPGATAEIELQLPARAVHMTGAADPNGGVALEEWDIANATEIEVVCGWSDTPFYHDTRPAQMKDLPANLWEKGAITFTKNLIANSAAEGRN